MWRERGRPYGEAEWVGEAVRELGLEHTIRGEGRPSKGEAEGKG